MSLQTRLSALITAMGADIKTLTTAVNAKATIVVIESTDSAPPGGTPAGTIVLKKR